jgi:hypothetical protein
MVKKSDEVDYLDIGLRAAFVKFDEVGTEPGYVNLWYANPNTLFPKVVKYPRPIHRTHIHECHTTKSEIPGVASKVIYILTFEEGSLMQFMSNKKDKFIEQLLSDKKASELQESTRKQIVEDIQAGVPKMVAQAKAALKPGQGERPPSLFGNPDDDLTF